jgi:hypothetical protein
MLSKELIFYPVWTLWKKQSLAYWELNHFYWPVGGCPSL